MLKAIAEGRTKLTSAEVKSNYNLGNPNTITRNKKVLADKSFIDISHGELNISDPLFKIWSKDNI